MSLVEDISKRDMNLFHEYLDCGERIREGSGDVSLVADFTEYNPLHNGHFHCMKVARSKVPDSLFVAIVPGLFERSGRGIPYILPRELRAEIAVSLGADVVVEGPPMGLMGSGQYSLCLCRYFQALNADYIPRGYNPEDGYGEILKRINMGHHVAPKPYKIVDKTAGEVLLRDKLKEDNYVIVSFSNSLSKIGFDYAGKFIFVERIEGVSGTRIRQAVMSGEFESVRDMMPAKTVEVLSENRDSIIFGKRLEENIVDNANNLDLASLNLLNEKLALKIKSFGTFDSVGDVLGAIPQGFSTHFKQRILSILENPITKDDMSAFIDKYPSQIRVLDYKNDDVLELFKEKVNSENISLS
ncbi:nucleotidyltransferase family protein [Methanobrevibacter sp.]|uniref:nucleotidyltransferase family protein n=1 Tax=Methanobrevibacter sp. TaxID=66852 RepID=UPI003890BA2B